MKIGLIGCGKVGTTLFFLLKKNNNIIGVYDVNKNNEITALRLLNIKKNLGLRELCRESEALFFATPDDQIVKVFKKIKPFLHGKKYVFHFSGLLPSSIFPQSKNISRASVHPFATFPKIMIPPKKKYFLFTEGDKDAVKVAKMIFGKRYFTLRSITAEQKVHYHLLGVFASNLLVGLVSAAYMLTKIIRWREKNFYEVVISIIEETLANIKKYKIEKALSGPLRRGDIEVIKKHVKTLKKDKDLLKIYKTISLYILKHFTNCKEKKKIENLLKKI